MCKSYKQVVLSRNWRLPTVIMMMKSHNSSYPNFLCLNRKVEQHYYNNNIFTNVKKIRVTVNIQMPWKLKKESETKIT